MDIKKIAYVVVSIEPIPEGQKKDVFGGPRVGIVKLHGAYKDYFEAQKKLGQVREGFDIKAFTIATEVND